MPRIKNPNLKKANTQLEYSHDQVQELVRCSQDPVYFVENYVRVQHPVKGIVPFHLRDYQKKMIRGFHENRWTVVLSARQSGKALHINEPIPTPSGWTTMGDVSVGDLVLDANGNPTQITGKSDIMYNHKCYRVSFSNNESIIADGEHLWEVTDEYVHKKKILTTEQMLAVPHLTNRKNQARFSVKIPKPLNLSEQQLPIDPYLLGCWLGDGNKRTGEIIGHEKDFQIITTLKEIWNNTTYTRPVCESRPHLLVTTFHGLRTKLNTLNLLQNKHIPGIYLRASFQQRLAVLQGIMDTDGTININGECEISLSNEQLSKDVYELLLTLGQKPTRSEKLTNFNTITYPIRFTAYRFNLPVFRLPRKLEKMKNVPHHTRKDSTQKRSIQKIEQVQSVPVQCITVDNEEHLFLAGRGMIPTHNSVSAGAFLLWYAMFHFDKTVLIASNKNDNAMEMIHRIRIAYENLPMWLKPGVLEDGWNKHSVGFDNGSRIISEATSESSGRGLSISLLYLDEFAFVNAGIQGEFWTSISPTLSTGGSCIMTSTPNGDSNIFAQIWRGALAGINGFHPIFVHWTDVPDRDEQFKDEEIGRIGIRRWMQEYECELLSSEALLIDSLFLANLSAEMRDFKPQFIVKEVKFWEQIKTGNTYLVGVDPATGSGLDYSVIEIFHFPSLVQVGEYRSNTTSTADLYEVLKNVLFYLESKNTVVYFSVENNGVGEGIISQYEADEAPPNNSEFVSEQGKNRRGMITTSRTKMRACVNLKEMIEKRTLTIKSQFLLSELKTFIRRRGAYAAQDGATDDCVAACLIVVRLVEEIASYDQVAFDKLYTQKFDQWGYKEEEYDENDIPMPVIGG